MKHDVESKRGIKNRWLVLGYGNEVRGDDAVGLRTTEQIAQWGLFNVQVLAVHQLTPELALRLSGVSHVVFVDASVTVRETTLQKISPAKSDRSSGMGHLGDPPWLLAVTHVLFGTCPAAWQVMIPVADLRFGQGLSQVTQEGMEQATRQIAQLIDAESLAWSRDEIAVTRDHKN